MKFVCSMKYQFALVCKVTMKSYIHERFPQSTKNGTHENELILYIILLGMHIEKHNHEKKIHKKTKKKEHFKKKKYEKIVDI